MEQIFVDLRYVHLTGSEKENTERPREERTMYRLSRFSTQAEPAIPTVFEQETPEASDIIRTVASALAENRLTLAFQPVVSAKNPKIPAFHECLVRIRQRDGSILPAARFMKVAEASDIGRLVDRAVLRQAMDILKDTQRVRLSVNLSANGLGDQEWLNILKEACQDAPQCGEFLIVEITENAIFDLTPEKLAFLGELRDLGCSIALDDFGAGHTSIGHLGKIRFDFLKIDGSYVRDVLTNQDNQFLIRSMVSIARHFDMVSVAEMVDSQEAADLLNDMGIDCLQGFEFGKPTLTPAWLEDRTSPVAWSL